MGSHGQNQLECAAHVGAGLRRRVDRFLPGLLFCMLLITAALLKLDHLNINSRLGGTPTGEFSWLGWTQSPPFAICLITAELLLALALLTVPRSLWLRRACVVALSIFASYALILAVSGAKSCGCFGAAPVSPWLTFVLDSALLAAFAGVNARFVGELLTCRVRAALGSTAAIALVITAFLVANREVTQLAAAAATTRVAPGSLVVLNPDEWIGKPFPLFTEFENPPAELARLREGTWTVLFVHAGCPDCERELEALADGHFVNGDALQNPLAVIEVPPLGDRDWQARFSHVGQLRLRFREDVEWIIETPQAIVLRSGVVAEIGKTGATEE